MSPGAANLTGDLADAAIPMIAGGVGNALACKPTICLPPSAPKPTSTVGDFFAGTKYTDKVRAQMQFDDNHSFPEIVKNFQGSGTISKITGGDGITRDILRIPGSYKGRDGVFEFIKEAVGSFNHRFPKSG